MSGLDVSVVVPTCDRPDSLASCLVALAGQTWPRHRYEVLVVDDGRKVGAAETVSAARSVLDVALVASGGAGPGPARNAGAALARGRILAFTDDDCSPLPGWLEAIAARVAFGPPTAAGGRTVNGLAHNPFSAASQTLQDFVYGWYNRDPEDARFFATSNLALPAEAFRAMGGFDASFGRTPSEDRDLCARWLEAGHRLRYAPDAVVLHRHAMRWDGFLRQHWGYGTGAWTYHSRRRARGQAGKRVEGLRFYAGMMRHPFQSGVPSPARIAGLIAVSQAASAAGFLARGAEETLRRLR